MEMFRALLVIAAMVFTACESPVPGASQGPRSPEPTSASEEISTDDLLAGSQLVRFRASDGVRLEGRLFGDSEVGVVLSHMDNADGQEPWWGLAALLADEGYRVLTYNRRGVCPGGDGGCSEGDEDRSEGWKDVVGAVAFLRSRGSDRVVVGGASWGAIESLVVAARRDANVDGLIWVAGGDLYSVPVSELVVRTDVPKLLMAGKFEGCCAYVAQEMYRLAPKPKELVLLPTGEHGTDVLSFADPAAADAFRRAILEFLEQV
jgi:dienelactone hydrolase